MEVHFPREQFRNNSRTASSIMLLAALEPSTPEHCRPNAAGLPQHPMAPFAKAYSDMIVNMCEQSSSLMVLRLVWVKTHSENPFD